MDSASSAKRGDRRERTYHVACIVNQDEQLLELLNGGLEEPLDVLSFAQVSLRQTHFS